MPDSSDQKITYFLEMNDRSLLRGRRVDVPELEIRQVKIACPELNWFLHQLVGAAFRWGGREAWDKRRWKAYVDRPQLETWVAYVSGAPAGYFELELQDDGSVSVTTRRESIKFGCPAQLTIYHYVELPAYSYSSSETTDEHKVSECMIA